MLFKVKKEYVNDILFIMDKGLIDFMEGCEKNAVFTKVSDKLKFYQLDTYVNVLYKNKIGWVNIAFFNQLSYKDY